MNYRHTEPKLCHRRRQIETPTVFNNVEEIPGAKENFCPLPQTWKACVLTELNGGGQSCYAQRRHWPMRSLSLTGLHHKFVKSRPPVAQAPGIYCLNWFSFNLWREAPGTETLSLYGTRSWGSRTQTHTVTLIERCPVHLSCAQSSFHPAVMLYSRSHHYLCFRKSTDLRHVSRSQQAENKVLLSHFRWRWWAV